ncbi:hypothetical protein [Bradyrhizobium centrolobii]|uniref:hypothetical protein n=1 Tax=Bradyrhizobium centrolobii TaxID=1505087 RepID=UPI0013747BA5|nr:hypothetical protein [Bradyrhizobium centrolobii]
MARLTSAISSSPSMIACPGEKFGLCWTSLVGIAAADALPASEKVSPAAPNAGTAALATRFFFEACFTRCMVASSKCCKKDIRQWKVYAEQTRQARFTNTPKRDNARSDCIHLHERIRLWCFISPNAAGSLHG